MIRLLYIARFQALAVLLLLLLALAPAMAQNVAYTGETDTLSVEQQPGDVYSWELYKAPVDPSFNFATEPGETSPSYAEFVGGTNTGTTVYVIWKVPGIYFFKVNAWDITGCTNNLRVGIIEVKISVTATMTSTTICVGETATITVEFTGTAPWSIEYTDGTTTKTVSGILSSPYELKIDPNPKTTTTYTITKVSDAWGANLYPVNPPTVIQEVNPKPNSSQIYKYGP